jgi:radical SAM-linked protein
LKNVRVWFEKQGAVRYISHLDLTRNMARGLKLSGLPVWYTEGFNPRIYMTYAMPLSLGVCGERECMDIRLTQEVSLAEIPSRMNAHLPADLRVLEATEPVDKFEDVQFADYEMVLETEEPTGLGEKLRELLEREEIPVLKHTKKGDKEFDIKPDFAGTQVEAGESGLLLRLRLPCSMSGSTNPALLLEALKRYEGEEPYCSITRKRLLLKDFSELR